MNELIWLAQVGQVLPAWQVPLVQTCPVPHCVLEEQAPHAPPEQTWPVGHCELPPHGEHAPEAQIWPEAHCDALEQGPQIPAEQIWPLLHWLFDVHGAWQAPPTQAAPPQSAFDVHARH
jgi:hypothetical protein